jgi:gas vesicle protein
MSKAKTILVTVAASVAVGAVLGMLYAPVEGTKAREKLKRLKQRLTCVTNDTDDDRDTLEELSEVLQKELDKINAKLEKL